MPGEHVLRRDVADGAVQSNVVVMLYVTLHQTPAVSARASIGSWLRSEQ
jgi:hypothetical protein